MTKYLFKFAFLLIALPLSAQSVVSSAQVQGGSAISSPTVTVSFKQTPLRAAVREIVEQSGIAVTYSPQSLPANVHVSYTGTNISVMAALEAIVKNTGVQIVKGVNGRITLVSDVASKNAAQGIITGKVTDAKTGRGVSGANVLLDNDTRGIMTDETGSYRLSGVTSGTHLVSVRLLGYAKQTRSVVVGEGVTITADFKLEPSANVLNEVVVTGTVVSTELKAVPSAITVITAKQIEERGITRIDQLFRGDVPGLFSMEQGADGLFEDVYMFSRGSTKISSATAPTNTASPIKTYVDGVELADGLYLSQIDPKSIEKIEILTGPQASTIYGANAINGVMQIFTKRGSTARPTVTLNLSEGFAQNNFSSALSPSHQYDGSISGLEGKISYNLGSGWRYTGAWSPGKQLQQTSMYGSTRYQTGTVSVDLSTRRSWMVNKTRGNASQVATALADEGILSRTFNGLGFSSKHFVNSGTFGVTLSYNPLPWWSHQINTGYDSSNPRTLQFNPSFARPSDTLLSDDGDFNTRVSTSYSSTIRFPLLSRANATITYGGDRWNTRESELNGTLQNSGVLTNVSVSRTRSKNKGVYIQGQFGFWDALFFTYGVRADWSPNYGENATVRPGRYGVAYARDFGALSAKIRGSYGRSIRPPAANRRAGILVTPVNAFDAASLLVFDSSPLYSTLPNPDLGPEFQQGGEGGLELYLGNRGSLVITRYNQTVDALVQVLAGYDSVRAILPGTQVVNGVTVCSESSLQSDGYCYKRQNKNVNAASIRNQGWELQGSINTGPFMTRGTYSWNKSRVIGVTPAYRSFLSNQALSPGQSHSYVPEHTWALNMSYSKTGTSISFNVNGLGQSLRSVSLTDLGLLTTSPRIPLEAYRVANSITGRLPVKSYITANMTASHLLSAKLEATLQVTNLTNYYQSDYRAESPVLGRQTRLGARIRF